MGQTALFPGTFDPLTLGHEQLIKRLSVLFDHVVVLVANNTGKKPFLSPSIRVEAITKALAAIPNVSVSQFEGLLVDFIAARNDGVVVVRGVRSVNDYLYEHDRAMMNQAMSPGTETLFLPASPQYSSLSSTLVREILWLKGDVSRFVSPVIKQYLEHYHGA